MHKITVPPSRPSTHYGKVVAIERHSPALKRVTIESLKLQQLNTAVFNTVQYSSLKYPGRNGICGSTGSVEFTPSPPEPDRCTRRDNRLLPINTRLPAANRCCYTGTDRCPAAVRGQTHGHTGRHSTVDKLPRGRKRRRRRRRGRAPERRPGRAPARGAWRGFACSLAAEGKPCYDL